MLHSEWEHEYPVFLMFINENEVNFFVLLTNKWIKKSLVIFFGLLNLDNNDDGDLFISKEENLESVVVEVFL